MADNMNNNWGMDKLTFWQQQYLFNQSPIKSPSFPQYWQYTPESQMQEDGIHRAYNSNSPSLVQHHIPPHNPNAGVQHMMQSMHPAQQQTGGFLGKAWNWVKEVSDPYDFVDEKEKRIAQNELGLAGSGASTGTFTQKAAKRAQAYTNSPLQEIFYQAPLDVKSAYYRAATLLSIAYGVTGEGSLRDAANSAMQSGNDTWRSAAGGSSDSVEILNIMQAAFNLIPRGVQSDFNVYPYNIWWTMDDIESSQIQAGERDPFDPLQPSTGIQGDKGRQRIPTWMWVAGGIGLILLLKK